MSAQERAAIAGRIGFWHTSILGMPARAIIDMVAVIGVIEDVLGAVGPLSALGWLQAMGCDVQNGRKQTYISHLR